MSDNAKDYDRVKRNLRRMIDGGAPRAKLDEYLETEGVSIAELQNIPAAKVAAEVGPFEAGLISAGKGASDIIAGAKNLYYKATGDTEAQKRLAAEQRMGEEAFAPLAAQRPVSTAVGGAAPYFALPMGMMAGMTGKGASLIGKGIASKGLQEAGGNIARSKLADAILAGSALGGATYSENQGTGALIGGAGGGIGYGLGRAMFAPKRSLSDVQESLAKAGQRMGMKLSPGYRTGSAGLQRLEAGMESFPLTSGAVQSLKNQNQSAANRVVAKSLGGEAKEISDQFLGETADRLSGEFKRLTDGKFVRLDDVFLDDLAKVESTAGGSWVKNKDVQNVIDNALEDAAKGGITGETYQNLSSQLGKAARSAMRGQNSNPELGLAIFQVKNALDSAAERSLGPESRAAFARARNQWKNLIAIESPGVVNVATGDVSLPTLANVLRRMDKTGYTRGKNQSDLYQAARFGQGFKPVVGTSGTAERMSLPAMMTLGAAAGGGGGYAGGGDATVAGAAGLAGMAVPAFLARGYMSPIARGYIERGLLPPLTGRVGQGGAQAIGGLGGRAGLAAALGYQ